VRIKMTVSDLVQEIRNFINNTTWKQHALLQIPEAWNMLCSCLDVIEDTELAIEAYNQVNEPQNEGEKYLLVYGILQTLFVEQDAVRHLCEALRISYTPDPSSEEVLKEIREIRNDSVGHPTKRCEGKKAKAFNFISRASLSKYGFDLIITYPDGRSPSFRHVEIPPLIEKQQQILTQALSAVLEELKKEESKHKAMFRYDPVQDAFPKELHYYFQKIYEAIHGNRPELGSMCLKPIAKAIEDFKTKLDKRGILKAYDEVTHLLELLDYPISQLSEYFTQPNSSTLNEKSAYIFASFVEANLEELERIALEIDREYDTGEKGTI